MARVTASVMLRVGVYTIASGSLASSSASIALNRSVSDATVFTWNCRFGRSNEATYSVAPAPLRNASCRVMSRRTSGVAVPLGM